MPKLSAEMKEQIHQAFHHPVKWLRGDGLPEEKVRPWEMAVHIVPKFFTGLHTGFTQNTMSLFQNVFGVDKQQQTYGAVALGLWDGLNDPVIGAFMDSRNYPISTHRWVMRVNVIISLLGRLLPMFSFGMTPMQHVVMFVVCRGLADFFGTFADVSGTKVLAHVTPFSAERRKLNWAQGMGTTITEMLIPVYLAVIGLRKYIGLSEYSIYVLGAAVFSIPSLFLDQGPSFVRQRVPDKEAPPSMGTGLGGFFLGLKESFVIVRHNRYFVLDTIARFVTVFTPTVSDNDFYRFCGVDQVLKTGKIKGEFLLWFRDNVVSLPCNIVVPFALPIIKKLGGPRRAQVLYQGAAALCNTLKWAVGMKTQGGILFNWSMEMVSRTLGRVNTVAENINKYDMFDYVEWKTGRRSEGVTMAVDGLLKKVVTNNIDVAVGNLVIHALGFDPKLEKKGLPQPAAFLRWAPTLNLLVPAVDASIVFIARLLYKYPAQLREQVEADLIERRRLAQEKKEELETQEIQEEATV